MADSKVNWYDDEVMLVVEAATDELLTRLAFQGEGLAKVNITQNEQVDTGFMRNAVYGRGPNGNHGEQVPASGTAHSKKQGRTVEVKREPVMDVGDGEAVVHAAANYSIYQEMRRPFLYTAIEQLKEQAGGTIETVGKEHFG